MQDISASKSIPFAEFGMIKTKRYMCVSVYFNRIISLVISRFCLGNFNCSSTFGFKWAKKCDRVGSIHFFLLIECNT